MEQATDEPAELCPLPAERELLLLSARGGRSSRDRKSSPLPRANVAGCPRQHWLTFEQRRNPAGRSGEGRRRSARNAVEIMAIRNSGKSSSAAIELAYVLKRA